MSTYCVPAMGPGPGETEMANSWEDVPEEIRALLGKRTRRTEGDARRAVAHVPRVAVTRHRKRRLETAPSSGGRRSEIKVSAGWVPPESLSWLQEVPAVLGVPGLWSRHPVSADTWLSLSLSPVIVTGCRAHPDPG